MTSEGSASERGCLARADLKVSQAFIDGQWAQGDAPPIPVDDPFTEDMIGEIPDLPQAVITNAIDSAEAAFADWSKRPAKARIAVLRKWHDLIMDSHEDLARLITLENGKPLREARGEVNYGAGFIDYYAQDSLMPLGEIIPSGTDDRRLLVEHEPVGVCAAITPWNFPLAMLTRKAAPALAAGCTMIAKPSELTPLTALAIAKLAQEAGLPDGVLNVVTGDAPMIGETLTGSSIVRKLSFTGSTRVGSLLMAGCAQNIQRVSLELGGNAPLIVYEDADLDTAVEAAMVAKFRNSGQSCIAANRIFVQSGIYSDFLEAFAKRVAALKTGDGFDESTDIGPLINAATVSKISRLYEGAVNAGANIVQAQSALSGRCYAPAILADIPARADILSEEIFGPLAAIVQFESIDEAIRLANDTPFGLAAYVCTSSPANIARNSRELQSGMLGINTGLISSPLAPFGGVKQSGLGREGSRHGLAEYQNLKYICEAGLG